MTIKVKRIYEPVEKSDGYRILVDRLWPRGIKKENARIERWIKEVGPSAALRKWFNHESVKWPAFVSKYKIELKNSAAYKELLALVKKHETITFLYSAKDEQFNQAVALKNFVEAEQM
jgi:uncharacterized protein YeaO (DUF488 family)